MSMTIWKCMSCPLEIQALAVACGHRCPARRHQWVDFVAADDGQAAEDTA
jgi:hypothetical protein